MSDTRRVVIEQQQPDGSWKVVKEIDAERIEWVARRIVIHEKEK